MTEAELLLFVHLTTLLCAFFLSGMLHLSEWQTRYATSLADLRLLTRTYKWGAFFAPLLILLVLSGARLASVEDIEMGDAWIAVSTVGAVVLFLSGPLVMAPHGKALGMALAQAGDGPVTESVRELVFDAKAWVVSHLSTGLALGIVFTMVAKPEALGSVLAVLMGAAAGAFLGLQRRKAALAGSVVTA